MGGALRASSFFLVVPSAFILASGNQARGAVDGPLAGMRCCGSTTGPMPAAVRSCPYAP